MANRVVVTGLGVVAPNGAGISHFTTSLKQGQSGIQHLPILEELKFSCQIAGIPSLSPALISTYFNDLELRNFNSSGITYGVIAGMEAWNDAGLPVAPAEAPDWDSGTIFGAGTSGIDKFREAIYKVDQLNARRIGSSVVIQTMASGVSAYLGGKLGLGNQVSTNSAACSTGAESVLMCYEKVKSGQAQRMLSGSTSDSGPYIWAGFDAMKVCTFKHNDNPTSGSRPMSATASGFVPGSGAGALVLENLNTALDRGAHIYAEVLGGHINSGGQRGGGSMTSPNHAAVQQCIKRALENAGVNPQDLDAINGHLTATMMDSTELKNWSTAINRKGADFPYINTLKGMTGHCLSAAGSIECVASVLQIDLGFLFPNVNCEDLHPEIAACVAREKVPQQCLPMEINLLAKASFGFGDVNACLLFKKYTS